MQKYVALANHIWDGFYLLVNERVWEKPPPDLQPMLADTVDAKALDERRDWPSSARQLQATLTEQGMQFNQSDSAFLPRGVGQSRAPCRMEAELWGGGLEPA